MQYSLGHQNLSYLCKMFQNGWPLFRKLFEGHFVELQWRGLYKLEF
jgi:hypothetical protein